jgi:hypothetical protein
MNLTSLGQIIAERKLVMRSDSGALHEVLLLLGKPQQFSDSTNYSVPVKSKERVARRSNILPELMLFRL